MLALIVAIIIIVAIFLVGKKTQAPSGSNQSLVTSNQQAAISGQQAISNNQQTIGNNNQQLINSNQQIQNPGQTIDPIAGALGRITKKPFGIFITPKTSPVQPERFQGYHSGSDLETTSNEQDTNVSVVALCDGKLLEKKMASGYGGVAVQACTLDGQSVTIVYGRLRLGSISAKIGDKLKAGYFLGNLGTGFSSESDGERRHLHLAIHKGSNINILGYVGSKSQLSEWLDPVKYLN